MLYDQIASNKRRTWILLLVFFLLLALVGYAVGYLFMRSGFGGLVIALIYVTISPSRSVRCETNKPPAMRVRVEGYTKKTPNAIQ